MRVHTTAEKQHEAYTRLLLPEGFGFGEGSISTNNRLVYPQQSGLTREAFEAGKTIILDDKRVWVPVGADDDGCGDGRPASVIYRMVPLVPDQPGSGLKAEVFQESLPRAKVFGGGLIIASSMMRAAVLGKITAKDRVLDDRKTTIDILQGLGIAFGAHTDTHARGDSSGCGAIDNYPATVRMTVKYREKVYSVVKTYIGDMWDINWENDFDNVYASYHNQMAMSATYFSNSEGRKTIDLIKKTGAVIKQLTDEHLEAYDVLNDVDGTTFNQRIFNDILSRHGAGAAAQVFAIDVWRGRMYARAASGFAVTQRGMNKDAVYRRSLIDFLARSTCGPSAALTDGSQPVFLRTSA